MPLSQGEHVQYTRDEFTTYPYYVDMIKILETKKIKSYVDIGANVGEFCKCMFEKLPTLTTAYLIEPEEANFKFMTNRMEELRQYCLHMFNVGITYNIKNPVFLRSFNVGGHRIIESENASDIKTSTLEDLKIPIVDLIKIDTEGGEYDIIENSSYLQEVEWLDIEFHDYDGSHPMEEYVEKFLPKHRIELSLGVRCLLQKI